MCGSLLTQSACDHSGILCTRFELLPGSAPVVLRFTRGADSCDPASPRFNDTNSTAITIEGGESIMIEDAADGKISGKSAAACV